MRVVTVILINQKNARQLLLDFCHFLPNSIPEYSLIFTFTCLWFLTVDADAFPATTTR